MKKLKIICIAFLSIVMFVSCESKVKIACVGDSITEGTGTKIWNKSSFPVVLDSLMGDNYTVMNCGRSSATMLRSGDLPYWKSNELSNVFSFQPDIIVIKLGTNDSKDYNWNAEKYEMDYQSLIDTFKTIPTQPKIYVCLPVPAYQRRWTINDSIIRTQEIPIIKRLADRNGLLVIDAYSKLENQVERFPDGIHPDEKGSAEIAEVIAEKLKE